jgi:hypothetical protein
MSKVEKSMHITFDEFDMKRRYDYGVDEQRQEIMDQWIEIVQTSSLQKHPKSWKLTYHHPQNESIESSLI